MLLSHKQFILCGDEKDNPTLKTMVAYSYCFCNVSGKGEIRIVSPYKVHKRTKTVVAFETSFLLSKPNE